MFPFVESGQPLSPLRCLCQNSNKYFRAARLIKALHHRERITPVLIELHWLPVKARVEFKIILLIYKALRYNEPKYLRSCLNFFRPETNVTIRHTSEIHRLSVPRANSKIGERAFHHYAPRLYNKIPPEMKTIQDEREFKKKLKMLLFSKSYDMENIVILQDYKL